MKRKTPSPKDEHFEQKDVRAEIANRLVNECDSKEVTKQSELLSFEQLEQWKDDIALWWRLESKRNSHKKTIIALQNLLNISKKEAVELEYQSRKKPERVIEEILSFVTNEFYKKLKDKDIEMIEDISLSCQEGANAYTDFNGQSFYHDVPGHVGIVGTILYVDQSKQKIFQRFISHPFWQYCQRSS